MALDVLKDLAKHDEPIPEPISLQKSRGKFVVRTTEDVHRKLAREAQEKEVST